MYAQLFESGVVYRRHGDGHVLQILRTLLGGYNDFLKHRSLDLLGRCRLWHCQCAGNNGGCEILVTSGLNMGFYRMRNCAAARLWITLFGGLGYHS
ncbi:MAG: hypothetical protein O6944_00795 [Gammaproteobacteria bacterium]|nr:hypothetical protein [Gammaproteobacteria bacterium]